MPKIFADVTIVPIGTANTSISDYVAASERLIKEFPDVAFKINPMSTTLAGELDRVLELIRRMHEAQFSQGAYRVSTSIRIDDRRDRGNTMDNKIQSVAQKAGLPVQF
ncbi:MTH1187 family thiamine-binding protein [Vampirovibrio chlorellavorus]|uniref:MTH1187 family thiamine-binding protein n=1 Tax=Vampirovibrio chlorellavorus TaxID=758823 RepID=UPI0026EF3CA3|nr:MTH1187 family thiamine-binding protein [Vampirovibrio chlorellavorus]